MALNHFQGNTPSVRQESRSLTRQRLQKQKQRQKAMLLRLSAELAE